MAIAGPIAWWLGRMASGDRLVEERLVWFWHDHFATSIAKVRLPYLMWQQHLTLREHATGNFGELLHAISGAVGARSAGQRCEAHEARSLELGTLQIAARQRRPQQVQLAQLAVRHGLPRRAQQRRLHARQRQADRHAI